MKHLKFWDIVVVNGNEIWVIVKCWLKGNREFASYEVYVRLHNWIKTFPEPEVNRYWVSHKYLPEEEEIYQYNFLNEE